MNFSWVKKHPYATGGLVLVGGLGLFLIMRGGSSSSASGVDPALLQAQSQADAQSLAASLQLQQTNAQLTGQTNQLTAQQNIATIQSNTAIDLATIQAGTSSQASILGTSVSLAQIQAQLQALQVNDTTSLASTTASLAAQVQMQQSNNQTLLGALGIVQGAKDPVNTQAPVTPDYAAMFSSVAQGYTDAVAAGTETQSLYKLQASTRNNDILSATPSQLTSIESYYAANGTPGAVGLAANDLVGYLGSIDATKIPTLKAA